MEDQRPPREPDSEQYRSELADLARRLPDLQIARRSARLLELLEAVAGRDPELKQNDYDELLAHPDLSPEVVGLMIDWACRQFEADRDELEAIISRCYWNQAEQSIIRTGYRWPYRGGPRQQTPWCNSAERAEGVFGLVYPEPRLTFPNLDAHHPIPARPEDRDRGRAILNTRVRWAVWPKKIAKSRPGWVRRHLDRIAASGDEYAYEEVSRILQERRPTGQADGDPDETRSRTKARKGLSEILFPPASAETRPDSQSD